MTDTPAPTTKAGRESTQSELTLALGDALRSMERIRRRASLAWGPDIVTVAEIHDVERSLRDALARSTPAKALDVPTFAVEVRDELTRARSKFGPIASLHEGYAVILEELDEFWEDVRSNDPDRLIRAYRELVQVAAMAQRTAEDAIARLRSPEGDR